MALILAQINPTIGDFTGNLNRMRSLVAKAAPNDAVFFALGSISGYLRHMPDQDFLAQAAPALNRLAELCPEQTLVSAYWNLDGLPTIFISHNGATRHIAKPRASLSLPEGKLLLSLTAPDRQHKMDEEFFIYLHPLAFNLVPRPQTLPHDFIYGWTNLVGGQDTQLYSGRSQWLMPEGVELRAPAWQEGEIAYNALPESIEQIHPMERLYRALVTGIKDYVNKNRFPSVLLGLSGGVDSALLALLAVQALGRERVHALTMPSPYSSKDTLSDAHLLAENLGITLAEVPILPIMQVFNQALGPLLGNEPPGLEQENLQARIRGCLLMTLANRYNHLLLTSSNRSESMVGYCTLYGDMTGGLAPIAQLYKTEVYQLCSYLDPDNRLIPKDIITRAPSAELRPQQTDQDSLPPYPLLDLALQGITEDCLNSATLLKKGIPGDIIEKTQLLMATSQHKRAQAPPSLIIRGDVLKLPLTGVRNYLPPDA